jgi:glycosyltransferase involved in cell wall biosynthesis
VVTPLALVNKNLQRRAVFDEFFERSALLSLAKIGLSPPFAKPSNSMKIAVITPSYRTDPSHLVQCLKSVREQTERCMHFLVWDGEVPTEIETHDDLQLIQLPKAHRDAGNAARAIGSVSAIRQGFDAIAYLDADNWYDPNHIAVLRAAHEQTNANVCSSTRKLWMASGAWLGICPEIDGEEFVDTNCLFLTRAAFGAVSAWYMMPPELVEIGDRVVWQTIKDAGLSRHHVNDPTVNYRTRYAAHYRYFGKAPPPGAKEITVPEMSATKNGQALSASFEKERKTFRVSLCMIARDEEANLDACLKSVDCLFEDIVVVDTGSSDRTAEIARGHGAMVVPFAWTENFAAARNESLRQAAGDFLFWLDADERVDEENRRKLRTLVSNLRDEKVGYLMRQLSAPETAGGAPLAVDQVRLFRIVPGACWEHRLHEQILPSLQAAGFRIVMTDIVIHHLGYSDASLREAKLARNRRIIEQELNDLPNNPFTLYNLANVRHDQGDYAAAVECFERSLEHAAPGTSFLPKVYVQLSQTCRRLGELEKAWAWCMRGGEKMKDCGELTFEEGIVRHGKKDFEGARACFERVLAMPKRPMLVGTDPGIHGHLARHHLAVSAMALGDSTTAERQWRAALGENPSFAAAALGLVEIYLNQGRKNEIDELLRDLSAKKADKAIMGAATARVCLREGDYAGACRLLETAIAESPKAVWLRLMLSDFYVKHGHDLDAAEKQLQEVLTLAPKNADARLRLSRIRGREGEGVAKSHD